MTIRDLLEWAFNRLISLGDAEAKASSERIIQRVLQMSRHELYLRSTQEIRSDERLAVERFIELRKERIPTAYLLGEAEFWNERLYVSSACLIPRPETELLIEHFIQRSGYDKDKEFTFLDLGSGSGAIGIAILRHFARSRGTFSDISQEALEVTQKNLRIHHLTARAEAVQSDLFEAFNKRDIQWDVIFCNPPYLSDADLANAQPELLKEPRQALYGGPDGLDFYRKIADQVSRYLKTLGYVMFEVGIGQSRVVSGWLRQKNYQVQISSDLNGIERAIFAQKVL